MLRKYKIKIITHICFGGKIKTLHLEINTINVTYIKILLCIIISLLLKF